MTEYQNNSDLINLLLRWWKHLLIVTIVAMLLSVGFSSPFIITPKFRSFAILYPANVIPMGTETPTEQMLQVLESDNIRDSLIDLYHLYEHYKISPDEISSRASIIRKYQENVLFKKTEYESVLIEVLDSDPVQARDMVNSIIYFFNRKERSLQKAKSLELADILESQVNKKKVEMDSMELVLTNIRKEYGILDYPLQTEYATARYLEMISSSGSKNKAEQIEPLLNALKEKGGEFVALNEHLWRVRGGFNDLKEQHEAAIRDVEKTLTYCNIITNPEVADKKALPIRWLIVLASTLGTLLICILGLSVLENIRGIKGKN